MSTDEGYFSRMYKDVRLIRREFVKAQASDHDHFEEEGFTFSLMHFNLLADGLTGVHSGSRSKDKFFNVDPAMLSWEKRGPKIMEEIRRFLPDVICLQELDQPDFVREHLESLGYSGIYKQREWSEIMRKQYHVLYSHGRSVDEYSEEDFMFWRNAHPDGCAVYWKQHKFSIDPRHIVRFVQQKDKQILREVLTRAAGPKQPQLDRLFSEKVDLHVMEGAEIAVWRALRRIDNILVTGNGSVASPSSAAAAAAAATARAHHPPSSRIELLNVSSGDIADHNTGNVFVDLLFLQGLINDEYHRLNIINQIKTVFGLGAHESRVPASLFVQYLSEKQTPNGLGVVLQPKRIAERIRAEDFGPRILVLTAQISERYDEIAYTQRRSRELGDDDGTDLQTENRRMEFDYIRREEMESVLTHPTVLEQASVPGTTTFVATTIYPPRIHVKKGDARPMSLAYKFCMGSLVSHPEQSLGSTYRDALGHGLHEPPFTSWTLRGSEDPPPTAGGGERNTRLTGGFGEHQQVSTTSLISNGSDEDTSARSTSPQPTRGDLLDEKSACDFIFYEPDFWRIERVLTIPSQSRLFTSRKKRVDQSPLPTRDYPSSHFAVMGSYRLDLKELHIAALTKKLEHSQVGVSWESERVMWNTEVRELRSSVEVLEAKCASYEDTIGVLSRDKMRLIEGTANEMQRLRDELDRKTQTAENYKAMLERMNVRVPAAPGSRTSRVSGSAGHHRRGSSSVGGSHHPAALSHRTKSTKGNSSFLARWLSMGFEDDESDGENRGNAYIESFIDELDEQQESEPHQQSPPRRSGEARESWGLARLVSNPFSS